jgi:arylsulfatase A-like enzyme
MHGLVRQVGRIACLALLVFGCAPSPRGGPVVLIVIDTLRSDHVGAYGDVGRTPFFDAWAARGRLFERCISASPWTLPSFGSLFTGLLPSHHGAGAVTREGTRRFFPLRPGIATLAERFAEHGYATGGMLNNSFLGPHLGLDRGFGTYDVARSSNETLRRADATVVRALDWVEAQAGAPFFLVIHFFDPHMNYDAPAPFRGRFTGGLESALELPVALEPGELVESDADRRFVAEAYAEEVAYADGALGALLDGLESRGVLRRGLVAVTSDHGEELFEHGSVQHGHAMWQEILHVPLLFVGAGVRPGRESQVVSLVDVAPTLLDAAGLPALPAGDGISLWPNLAQGEPLPTRTVIAEGILFGPERKIALRWPFKLELGPGDRETLYHLDDDPRESRDAAQRFTVVSEQLVATLRERSRGAPLGRPHRPAALDPAEHEALRAMGYVD